MHRGIILPIVIMALGLGGCIELAALITGTPLDPNGGKQPNANGNPPGGGQMPDDVPQVTLAVSNTSPSFNEEVALACRSIFGSPAAMSFEFQPSSGLIDINPVAGTAVFLPSESDVGTAFRFTCTGINEAGTSAPSEVITVIPVGGGLE